MRPPIALCAQLLAAELVDLEDERRALNLLAAAGYEPCRTAPLLDVITSLARELRAELADVLSAEPHYAD